MKRLNFQISTRAESGFTMVELIIAAAMMVVITGATVSLLVSVLRQQPEVTQRADQIGDARNALEKLTVDLRQGSQVTNSAPESLSLDTICDTASGSQTCSVEYACAEEGGGTGTFECTRAVDGEAARQFVTGLDSPEVFCVVPSTEGTECGETNGDDPTYVGVKIEFPATKREAVTVLEGGAALHNLSAGEGG